MITALAAAEVGSNELACISYASSAPQKFSLLDHNAFERILKEKSQKKASWILSSTCG